MKAIFRAGVVIVFIIGAPMVLAFVGVNWSEKPVPWMLMADLVTFLIMFVGIAWTFLGIMTQSKSKRGRCVGATMCVLAVPVGAYLAFTFRVWFWFLFGGSL
jgi:hypothetical protein